MRIYTKKGDKGTTSLFRGGRVQKDSLRVAAYGDIDELNATVGVAAAAEPRSLEEHLFEEIQRDLFAIGAMLSDADQKDDAKRDPRVSLESSRIVALEKAIDAAVDTLPPLRRFVLPGGSQKAATLHHSRTVCRRAERSAVALSHEEYVPGSVIPYLNRLSDLLFVLARVANQRADIADREW